MPLKCPYVLGGRACVVCDEMTSCDAIEVKQVDEKNLKLVVAGNSAMLSLKYYFKTDIEQFIMAKLFISLQNTPELPIIKPEEGYSLTFYTKHGQATPKEQQYAAITKVLDLLSENPWIETKMLINNWINRTLEKLKIEVKMHAPKVTLKTTPTVKRSKVFEKPDETIEIETRKRLEQTPDQEVINQTPHEDIQIHEVTVPTPQETVQPAVQEVSEPDSKEIPAPEVSSKVSDVLEETVQKPKVPKQPFFTTAKEREKEFAPWPPHLKRKKLEEKKEAPKVMPSVTERKRIVTKKSTEPRKGLAPKTPIPKEEKFELRIHERKQATEKYLPPMPKDDPYKILTHLERIVQKDYEMRQLAARFEEARDKIKQTMFHSRFLFEMGQVAFTLRKGAPGLSLNESTRKDILKKISTWKGSVERKTKS